MINLLIGAGLVLSLVLLAGLSRQSRSPGLVWAQVWFATAFVGFLAYLIARETQGFAALIMAAVSSTALTALIPLQYIHIRQVTGAPVRLLWPHALVPVGNIVLILAVYASSPLQSADGVVVTDHAWGQAIDAATILISLGLSLYPLAGMRRILHAQGRLRFHRRAQAAADFNWLLAWCAGTLLFLTGAILGDLGGIAGRISAEMVGYIGFGALTVQLVLVGMYSATSSRALDAMPDLPDAAPRTDLDQLTQSMRKERPYLEPGLSAEALADRLGWGPERLTQTIRGSGASHFNDYLNRWRVDAVCEAIRAGGEQSILDLALEAGFGSKSSFNEAFKRHTGLSPSEYRKRQNTRPD